ncbi:hypothetical protein GOP96_17680 [Vibrio cholerae]|nr:hypothetical protein [Vibrio cholerae]
MNLQLCVINKKVLTTALSLTLMSISAYAGGLSDGNWEFENGLEVVGHPDYDKTLVFSIYNTSLDNFSEIKGEIQSIADMTNVFYQDMDNQLVSAYGEVEASVKSDYSGLNTTALQYFNEKRYIEAKMPSGLVVFNLRLNSPVVYRAFRTFNDFEEFKSIVISEAFFDYPENWHNYSGVVLSRFSESQLTAIKDAFKTAYGIDITKPNTQILMANSSNEVAADVSLGNGASVIHIIELSSGKALKPFKLVRFQY